MALDIFDVLNAVNRKDRTFFEQLDESQQKSFAPVVVARWMTGTSSEMQVSLVNHAVNPYVFNLFRHRDLLYKLMVAASDGKQGRRYQWIKQKSRAKTKPLLCKLMLEAYGYSESQTFDVLLILDPDDALTLALDRGWAATEITALKKELK